MKMTPFSLIFVMKKYPFYPKNADIFLFKITPFYWKTLIFFIKKAADKAGIFFCNTIMSYYFS